MCNNQGLPQLLQHAWGQSHKTLTNEILGFASTHSEDVGKSYGNSASNAEVVLKQQETDTGEKESSGTLECTSLE